jgi:hypothetical protein
MNQTDQKGKIPYGSNPIEILRESYESKEALEVCSDTISSSKLNQIELILLKRMFKSSLHI